MDNVLHNANDNFFKSLKLNLPKSEPDRMLDEYRVLEAEPKKYSYDEVLECMRQACTLSLMSNEFPKDSELEQLIPRSYD